MIFDNPLNPSLIVKISSVPWYVRGITFPGIKIQSHCIEKTSITQKCIYSLFGIDDQRFTAIKVTSDDEGKSDEPVASLEAR